MNILEWAILINLLNHRFWGHEASGEIVAIGEDVVDFKIGDCVTIEPW